MTNTKKPAHLQNGHIIDDHIGIVQIRAGHY